MTDLGAVARDLMSEREHDLGTKLDWTAVDHWNTEHPDVHITCVARATTTKTW
jgi:type IV secretory pathway VirD2 relaxase